MGEFLLKDRNNNSPFMCIPHRNENERANKVTKIMMFANFLYPYLIIKSNIGMYVII